MANNGTLKLQEDGTYKGEFHSLQAQLPAGDDLQSGTAIREVSDVLDLLGQDAPRCGMGKRRAVWVRTVRHGLWTGRSDISTSTSV